MKPSWSQSEMPFGSAASICGRRLRTSSTIATVLPPLCLRMPMPTEYSPLKRASDATSSAPRATSRSSTAGRPGGCATTMPSSSVTLRNSASVFTE